MNLQPLSVLVGIKFDLHSYTFVQFADVGHLKTERRVMVHSLSWDEVNHPSLVQTVLKDSCEEIKLNFVRPKDNPQAWSGLVELLFVFMCCLRVEVHILIYTYFGVCSMHCSACWILVALT